jgi:hypothetical protein
MRVSTGFPRRGCLPCNANRCRPRNHALLPSRPSAPKQESEECRHKEDGTSRHAECDDRLTVRLGEPIGRASRNDDQAQPEKPSRAAGRGVSTPTSHGKSTPTAL